MMKELYKHSIDQLGEVDLRILEIEKNIFAGKEGKTVEAICRKLSNANIYRAN